MGGHDLPLDNADFVDRIHAERRASVANVMADRDYSTVITCPECGSRNTRGFGSGPDGARESALRDAVYCRECGCLWEPLESRCLVSGSSA